jgi:hypothetical protein
MANVICEPIEPRRLLAANIDVLHGIGVLGDSYSDEYQFYPPDRTTSRNYVEALAKDRGLNFGDFTASDRGDSRHQGFSFNWANDGDTTTDMLNNQLPGLVAQVKSGQVTTVFIFIGGDDVLEALDSNNPISTLQSALPAAISNFKTTAKAILSADKNVRLVVTTIPDVRKLPIVSSQLANVPDVYARQIGAGVNKYNTVIRNFAASHRHVALADAAKATQQLFSRKQLTIDDTTIDRTAAGDDIHDLVLADQIHAGTAAQGILANLYIKTMNRAFHTHVQLLNNAEILGG